MNRTMPCLQMNKLYILGSWSQCMRKNEWGLSKNRNSQTRNPNDETGDRTTQSIWTFGLRISFVIRHSPLVIQRFTASGAGAGRSAGDQRGQRETRPGRPTLSARPDGGVVAQHCHSAGDEPASRLRCAIAAHARGVVGARTEFARAALHWRKESISLRYGRERFMERTADF